MNKPKTGSDAPARASTHTPSGPCGFMENFRQAAKGRGTFCPVKKELLARRSGVVYRITFDNCIIRLQAPDQPEVTFLLAPDATVDELKRALSWMLSAERRNGHHAE